MSSHAGNDGDKGKEQSLDDLSAIMNLQRQEAFDESLEEVHATLSKRDSIRKKLSLRRPPTSPRNSRKIVGAENNAEDAGAKLLQIITSQASRAPSSPETEATSHDGSADRKHRTKQIASPRNIQPSTHVSSNRVDRRGSASKVGDSGDERRRSTSQSRLGSSSRRRSKSASNDFDLKRSRPPPSSRGRVSRTSSGSMDIASTSKGKEDPPSRRRSSSRKRSGRCNPSSSDKDGNDDDRSTASLELEEALRKVSRRASREGAMRNPVDAGDANSHSSRSVSRNSISGSAISTPRGMRKGTSARINRSARTQERRQSSRRESGSQSGDLDDSKASLGSLTNDNRDRGDTRDSLESARRRSMTKQISSPNINDRQAASVRPRRYGSHIPKAYRSKSVERDIGRPAQNGRTIPDKSTSAGNADNSDRKWKDASKQLVDFIKGGSRANDQSRIPVDMQSVPASPSSPPSQISDKPDHSSVTREGTKKTKLEKIHELQAKCDRYKNEWMDASNEKRRYRRDLETAKSSALALSKQVETHVAETTILQKSLSTALLKLDETHEEQRKERNELSSTAKDLAQSRIDHAKSVNECREVRSQLDEIQQQLAERGREISALKSELASSKEHVAHLEADVAYADEQIEKLEGDIKVIEVEVQMYRDAADNSGTDQDGGSETLRGVRDEMEKRLYEERESRLDEKQRKLDERMKQFEEEKERYLEIQKAKEREFLTLKEQEIEKSKSRDADRQKLDDEINSRLIMLENDNTALQGRLKSEQLDSTMKMKSKDETIEKLEQELILLKTIAQQRDADPSSLASMQEALEAIQTDASNTKMDLKEEQKQNGMMQEEVDDLRAVNNDLKTSVTTLHDKVDEQRKEIEALKRKAADLHRKSGEWSGKAFEWKEKAERWEKTAKSLDPDAKSDLGAESAQADPQALFLLAAVEKKRTGNAANNGATSSWLGGIFNKASETEDDAHNRIDELEVENAKQLVEIKQLKSEMVKMQTMYKDIGYCNQQLIEQLQKENEAVELKCSNLTKELELARKLNHSMAENCD